MSAVAGAFPISGQVTCLSDGSGSDTHRQSARRLVVAAKAGDTAAFGSLVELHQQRVFRTARSILGNDAAAEDAAQEAFLRAFRHIASFDSERSLSAWLYKLTVNARRDVIRRKLQGPDSVDYNIAIAAANEVPTPKAIKLSLVKIELRRRGDSGDEVAEISTNLTASHGKTLIVGKAGVRAIADGIFLLLTARLD